MPWKGLREGLERLEGFGGFEGGQTAALNALKNRWQGHVAARVVALKRRVPLPARLGVPVLPWQTTREPSSTPPVVPGAAPALAKAGVGGYAHIFDDICRA